MRLLRVLAVATGFAALLPQTSVAQDGRQFKDAWFWGVKGGGLMYASATTTGTAAPLVGADWLITRTNGGLYVSFDQAFLKTTGGFVDQNADSIFIRNVTLKNLRRLTVAAMVFPMQQRDLHPYAGLGLALHQIAGAVLENGPPSDLRSYYATQSIQSAKTVFSPVLMGGVQARLHRMSLFGQVTASPQREGFFLYNSTGGRAFNYSLEFGARYNVGSSIDRAR